MKTLSSFALLSVLLLLPFMSSIAQQNAELTPAKDNTLYQSASGATSNGAGSYLFFGETNQGALRRALIQFDVASSIPAGATIQSAVLQVTVTKTTSGAMSTAVHRVQQDWGEGTSDASANEGQGASSTTNDATWIHTFFDSQMWQNVGGDFDSATLTSAQAGSGGLVEFPSSPEMVSLVQSWLDTPAENFGVIIIGDENGTRTAKRIGSREGAEADRPKLAVTYSVATATERSELPDFLTELSTYPNPAATEATVRYELGDARDIRIDVIDVTGRMVATPVQGVRTAGSHLTRIDTGGLTPGLYLVRLISEGRSASRTMIVR